jgi:threonine/homoserine/homoserine lactone efflux protein
VQGVHDPPEAGLPRAVSDPFLLQNSIEGKFMFSLYPFLTYLFITAYTPGPNNIMSLSHAVRYGFKKSFPFNLGILAGFSIVMLVCTLVSALIFSYLHQARLYMEVVGAAYMLYLAWKTWKSSSEIELDQTRGAGFLSGLSLQFINPKIYIYAVTAMSTYILPYFDSTAALIGFAFLLALIGFSGTVAWSLFGSSFRRLLSAYARIVNPLLAVLLVYCAVSLFL